MNEQISNIQNKIIECPNCKRLLDATYTDLDCGVKKLICPFCNHIFWEYLPKSYMPK